MSENALTSREKYTQYCAVTCPPRQRFDSRLRPAVELATAQNAAEKSIEAYHSLVSVSSDCSHIVLERGHSTGMSNLSSGSGICRFCLLGLRTWPPGSGCSLKSTSSFRSGSSKA